MSRNLAEWEAVPALPHSHFVDNAIYTDETVFREEQAKIFGAIWKFVCHEGEIPSPTTSAPAGSPISRWLSRAARTDKVRTFVNSCSHRGTVVVTEPSGNARNWTCVFHRWVYNNQGACIAIPRDEAYRHCDIDRSKVGLREVRTEVRLGLVFVNLDDDAAPLDEFLGDALSPIKKVLGERPLEPFHFHRTVLESNWKLWQLTNNEPYHEIMHVYNRQTNLSKKEFFEREFTYLPNGHLVFGLVQTQLRAGNPLRYRRRPAAAPPGSSARRMDHRRPVPRRHDQRSDHRGADRQPDSVEPDQDAGRIPGSGDQGRARGGPRDAHPAP